MLFAEIQKLVLAGRMGEAIEYTRTCYPGLLESNAQLLFMLKCRQFVELVGGCDVQSDGKSVRTAAGRSAAGKSLRNPLTSAGHSVSNKAPRLCSSLGRHQHDDGMDGDWCSNGNGCNSSKPVPYEHNLNRQNSALNGDGGKHSDVANIGSTLPDESSMHIDGIDMKLCSNGTTTDFHTNGHNSLQNGGDCEKLCNEDIGAYDGVDGMDSCDGDLDCGVDDEHLMGNCLPIAYLFSVVSVENWHIDCAILCCNEEVATML